jgi:hypothetical protein
MDQVNQILAQLNPILNDIYQLIRTGFYEVNDVRGILIAAVGAYVLTSYLRVPVIVLGCLVADVAVRVLGPVIVNKESIRLPPLVETTFWTQMLALALGYLIIVSALYLVKRLFQRLTDGGHGAHAHGH